MIVRRRWTTTVNLLKVTTSYPVLYLSQLKIAFYMPPAVPHSGFASDEELTLMDEEDDTFGVLHFSYRLVVSFDRDPVPRLKFWHF